MVRSGRVQLGGDLLGWFQPPSESTAQFITTGYINRPQSAGKTTADTQAGRSSLHMYKCAAFQPKDVSLNVASMRLVVVRSVSTQLIWRHRVFLELSETSETLGDRCDF